MAGSQAEYWLSFYFTSLSLVTPLPRHFTDCLQGLAFNMAQSAAHAKR